MSKSETGDYVVMPNPSETPNYPPLAIVFSSGIVLGSRPLNTNHHN
jgi:hypothetical protein